MQAMGYAMTADQHRANDRAGGMARKLAIFAGLASLGLAGFAVALMITPNNPIQIRFGSPAATPAPASVRADGGSAAGLGGRRPGSRRAALGPDPHRHRRPRQGGADAGRHERPGGRGRGAGPARGQGGPRPPRLCRGASRPQQARARQPAGRRAQGDQQPRQHQPRRGRGLHGRARRHQRPLRARRCHCRRSQERRATRTWPGPAGATPMPSTGCARSSRRLPPPSRDRAPLPPFAWRRPSLPPARR